MPELGSYGSVRGARGNSRPYREPRSVATEPFSAGPDLCLLLPQERPFGAWVWKVAKGQKQTPALQQEAYSMTSSAFDEERCRDV